MKMLKKITVNIYKVLFLVVLFVMILTILYLLSGCSMFGSTGYEGTAENVNITTYHWTGEIWAFIAGAGVFGVVVGWFLLKRPKLFRRGNVE